jgi:hypothetical protein
MRLWFVLIAACADPKPVTECSEGTARVAEGHCEPVAGEGPSDSADPDRDPDTDPEPDTADTDTAVPSAIVELVPLDPPRLLRRMSLDLRGVLPTVAELDAVEADPDAIDEAVERYLADPGFEERLVALFAETWHTQVDDYLFDYFEYPALVHDPTLEFPFERSAGDEPLRLMARVAAADRPWTEILTADYTMANPLMASIWPIDLSADATGWEEARYTDGRPAAGVLATNGLWMRYYTAGTNYNRGRAAAITRLLICQDFLARPVSFSTFPSLADAEATEQAIKEEPYCLGCHSAVDPIAASLMGFWTMDSHNGDEAGRYHPEREPLGEVILDVNTEWFGAPVRGLAELSRHIAADKRFRTCTTQTMARALWRRDVGIDDFGTIQALQTDFEDGDGRLKALVTAVLQTPQYQVGSIDADPGTDIEVSENTARMLMPDQISRVVDDLTGFSWQWDGFDQLANDTYGFRVMLGGVNGFHVTRPQVTPSVTYALVVQRISEAGARTVVIHDLEETPDTPKLFSDLSLDDRPGDPAFDAALAELYWHLLAIRASESALAELSGLWSSVESDFDATEAWVAIVSALIRHPAFVSY